MKEVRYFFHPRSRWVGEEQKKKRERESSVSKVGRQGSDLVNRTR